MGGGGRADFVGVPKFSGQGAIGLGPMDRQVTKDATVFTVDLPEGVRTWRAEGGFIVAVRGQST